MIIRSYGHSSTETLVARHDFHYAPSRNGHCAAVGQFTFRENTEPT